MWWWVLPAAALIGAAAWGTAEWLLQDLNTLPVPERVSARIEAARTALAAAAGVGAAVTLMLAVRRQRHQELATAHITHDAAERRVTELYTKAAEQLGNAQAPVRLAGLHALERLAQDTPPLRQTIVDVICSYLRMPYTPPREDRSEKIRTAQRAARTNGTAGSGSSGRNPQEERQVRLTAQHILEDHLRYRGLPKRRWWQSRHADPNPRYWPNVRLDLAGATLIDLDLRGCFIGSVRFVGATFYGEARFAWSTFYGAARFDEATFTREARFDGATFTLDVQFDEATFAREAEFVAATFAGTAWFDGATFAGTARFDEATFIREARFDDAAFTGTARFGKATFIRDARFDEATGLETAALSGVRLAPAAPDVRREWPPNWQVADGADGWQTLSRASDIDEAASG